MREKISIKKILVLGIFILLGSFWFCLSLVQADIAGRENCSWNQVNYGHDDSNDLGCMGYWINGYDDNFNYICFGNKVIAGVCSHHNNGKEDRKFNFYCCQVNSATRINGSWNQVDYGHGISNDLGCMGYWINGYDDEFTYICPGNKVIAGVCSLIIVVEKTENLIFIV